MKDFPRNGYRQSKTLIVKKSNEAKRSSLRFAISWIVMIVVALFFVQQRISYIQTEKDVKRLMEIKNEIQLSILPLKLEKRFLTRHETVERIARDRLGLQVPRKVQIIPVKK